MGISRAIVGMPLSSQRRVRRIRRFVPRTEGAKRSSDLDMDSMRKLRVWQIKKRAVTCAHIPGFRVGGLSHQG